MARRKRRYGAPPEIHYQRAQSTIREVRRLSKVIRAHLKPPADCENVARFLRALAYQEGAFDIDSFEGGHKLLGRRTGMQRLSRGLFDRFVRTCVVKPRSKAAERKMRAVWR